MARKKAVEPEYKKYLVISNVSFKWLPRHRPFVEGEIIELTGKQAENALKLELIVPHEPGEDEPDEVEAVRPDPELIEVEEEQIIEVIKPDDFTFEFEEGLNDGPIDNDN